MSPFQGFPSGKTRQIPIPASFFLDLLPQIDHLDELKVTLYAIWLLSMQEGNLRFLRHRELLADETLLNALRKEPAYAKTALADGLERAWLRGTLLKSSPPNGGDEDTVYFLNTARGRTAQKALAENRVDLPEASGILAGLVADRPNIFRLYEENIGPLTPLIADSLRQAEADYPAAWIEKAVRIAVENNVRRWRYVEAILKSWKEGGVNGKGRQGSEADRKRYLEGEFSQFIELEEPVLRTAAGDPNCPNCGGVGFVRQDLPVGHPDFGRLLPCSCRSSMQNEKGNHQLYRSSNLEPFSDLTFELFQPRGHAGLGEEQIRSLDAAFSHAQHYSRQLGGWLLFTGGYGCGKTTWQQRWRTLWSQWGYLQFS